MLIGRQAHKINHYVAKKPDKTSQRAPLARADAFMHPYEHTWDQDKKRTDNDRPKIITHTLSEGCRQPVSFIFCLLGIEGIGHRVARQQQVEEQIWHKYSTESNQCLEYCLAAQ